MTFRSTGGMRLRVIQPEASATPSQDCSSCLNIKRCYDLKVAKEHVLTNILTCRIKRGIDVNASTKALLELLRPKILKLAEYAKRGTSLELPVVIADFESQIFEELVSRYDMGGAAYPLHFLFGLNGYSYRYANNYGNKTRAIESSHSSLDEAAIDALNYSVHQPALDELDDDVSELTRIARRIIDDGITLSHWEYRILRFFLDHSDEPKRNVTQYLCKVLNLTSVEISALFKSASEKIQRKTLDEKEHPRQRNRS